MGLAPTAISTLLDFVPLSVSSEGFFPVYQGLGQNLSRAGVVTSLAIFFCAGWECLGSPQLNRPPGSTVSSFGGHCLYRLRSKPPTWGSGPPTPPTPPTGLSNYSTSRKWALGSLWPGQRPGIPSS